MEFSSKYWDFIDNKAEVEILEGTTSSGKTVSAIFKFFLEVAESAKNLHVIAARNTGSAEKNLINSDLGIKAQYGNLVEYNGNGDKDNKFPHIRFATPNGDKVVYILGYSNKDKWENALGSQFGCVLIDEINIADIEFVREITGRCDYMLATLNPDDPNLPVYKEYINKCRPVKKYEGDIPREILRELKEQPIADWRYWFFDFSDNVSMSPEDIEQKKSKYPPGTKIYKNKILGLRGKATGLVFSNFGNKHIVDRDFIKERIKSGEIAFRTFTAGLDTAYSSESPDTIAMSFEGITTKGQLIYLDERKYIERRKPL